VLAQRQELLSLRSERAQFDAQLSKYQLRSNQLQTELQAAQSNRFNHPLVYGGGLLLLGAGALWMIERRKRLAQDKVVIAQRSRLRQLLLGPAVPTVVSSFDQENLQEVQQEEFKASLPGLEAHVSSLPALDAAPAPVVSEPAPTDKPMALSPPIPVAAPATKSPEAASVPAPMSQAQSQAPIAAPTAGRQSGGLSPELLTMQEEERRVLDQSRPWWKLSRKKDGPVLDASSSLSSSNLSTQTVLLSSRVDTALQSTQFISDSVYGAPTQVPPDTGFQPEPGAGEERQVPLPAPAEPASRQDTPAHAAQKTMAQADEPAPFHARPAMAGAHQTMDQLLELRTSIQALEILGRADEALMLLDNHVDAHPGSCAWVYMEYFAIATRLDRRDLFDDMRQRYRLHFNRLAPYWGELAQQTMDLEGYPKVAAEIATCWPQPVTKTLIEGWLLGPSVTRRSFQLRAYHDLFDLYELLEFIDRREVEPEDFVPTVSLLDLDFEFSTDVRLDSHAEEEAARSVPIVKTGDFAVDFNTSGTQMGSLNSLPAELGPDAFIPANPPKPGSQ
jgi:hypothetical protein